MALNTIKDRWAFLEEIEAPMWVDLDFETKCHYQDIDSTWFHTSHPFHQSSSSQLKAAFAHSGESSISSKLELKGSSSPKIPLSVSRTRGKEFKSKKWKGLEGDFELNWQHPVMNLNGKFHSGSGNELKPKLSFIRSSGTSRLKNSGVSENGSVGNAKGKDFKAIPRQRGLDGSLNLMVDKATESNTSTITYESYQQLHQRNPEITSLAFGHSSGLLSALKIGLRKSCATRPASRVENGIDGKPSRERKSSCSKSSVGSSSYPHDDAKKSVSPIMLNEERALDSRTVARMTEAARNKAKESNIRKAFDVRQKNNIGKSSRGAIGIIAKSTCQDLVKPKVQLHVKALNSWRVNEQVSVGAAKVKEKVKAGRLKRLVGAGKENKTRTMRVSEKCTAGKVSAEGMLRNERARKINLPQKCDRTGFDGQKAEVSSKGRSKSFTTGTQRVHFR